MSDRLEKFIQDNKKQLDGFEAPELMWDKIDAGLNEYEKKESRKVKMNIFYSFMRVAAVLLLVCTAGYIFVAYQNKEALKLSNISPEYAKKEIRFASLIEMKQEEIKSFGKLEPNLYKAFVDEQNKLEKEYNELEKELPNTPNQDRVVKAMIRNLQAQISLLNQQLNIIEEVKQLKSTKNETISI
ncbi:hypothetical protein [Pedobacter cryophilus]|uniref:Anti-sigma factor n=1 Tax=Pedobacter cryophilus TaxID=2571271 RepID=A0A4U1C5I4_9SPHI|nr:hypothetical protein [Pedobacter cryophilus]TKC00639.1 hypothetical protein FA046_02870 [Pedobacter cryophilus]